MSELLLPAPVKVPRWLVPVLVLAIFASVAATTIIATRLSAPAPIAPTQTAAEQTFLRIMGSAVRPNLLQLGHRACSTMGSGNGTYAQYRLAEGELMSYYRVSPGYAQLIVHTALVSGLCTEAKQ